MKNPAPNHGFTLVEALISMVIISTLALFILPGINMAGLTFAGRGTDDVTQLAEDVFHRLSAQHLYSGQALPASAPGDQLQYHVEVAQVAGYIDQQNDHHQLFAVSLTITELQTAQTWTFVEYRQVQADG